MVKVLNGHTSPETAYVVDDYPYGYRLRCKIRYWLERATKGPRRGAYRLMSQTTNPKKPGEVWNKPKASIYHDFGVMYLDEKGHVTWTGFDLLISVYKFLELGASGLYWAMSDEQRCEVGASTMNSRRVSPHSWADFDRLTAHVSKFLKDNPTLPRIDCLRILLGVDGLGYESTCNLYLDYCANAIVTQENGLKVA